MKNPSIQFVALITLDDLCPITFVARTRAAVEQEAREEIELTRRMFGEFMPSGTIKISAVCSDCLGNGRRFSRRPNEFRQITCPSCKGKDSETILKSTKVQG